MFIITQDGAGRARTAMDCFAQKLGNVTHNPLIELRLGPATLLWRRTRPSDNLHVFRDGVYAGLLSASERESVEAIAHPEEPLPSRVETLLPGVEFRVESGQLYVTPSGITPVFASRHSVSDMQLLIAAAEDLWPSVENFGFLATTGYFPGNLTLFEGVKKIPWGQREEYGAGRSTETDRFEPREPDDRLLVERLLASIPGAPGEVFMSGGYDSRFVLGLLHAKGVRTQLLHWTGTEREIVREVGRSLGVPVRVAEPCAALSGELYTLMTDAQIYYRGGNYSRLREALDPECVHYFGLGANCILKKAYKGAWKLGGQRRGALRRLCGYVFGGFRHERIPGLGAFASRADIVAKAEKELAFLSRYEEELPAHALASVFFYFNSVMRWLPATLGDLSYFTRILCPLTDTRAVEFGIRSSAWSNFRHDRVRGMNRRLLPSLDVTYSDGASPKPIPAPLSAIAKLRYEYYDRAFAYFRGRRARHSGAMAEYEAEVGEVTEFGLESELAGYLDQDLNSLLRSSQVPRAVKRGALTLHHAMGLLLGVRRRASA